MDAFLDAENVEAVTKYLTQLTLDNACQNFVISHKEHLAQKTDSLVGVAMIPEAQSSKAFSVDLR